MAGFVLLFTLLWIKKVIKWSNPWQEVSLLKPNMSNPIKKCMQQSLHMDISDNVSAWLQQDFHKSREMWQKWFAMPFFNASVQRRTH